MYSADFLNFFFLKKCLQFEKGYVKIKEIPKGGMPVFVIQLAGLRVRIENRFSFIEQQCRAYLCEDGEVAFSVSATPDEILEEQKNGEGAQEYCESICIYRNICERMADYNIFLMHSSVLEKDGYAYAFAAKSGVGKSTHTALWMKNIEGARILNGDKPLYRLESDGTVTVFGTPWNGKENWGENCSATLAAVCFLERGEENEIRIATEEEALDRLIHQLYLRGARVTVTKQLAMMDAMISRVPFYIMKCTISDDAAKLAYQTMCKSH